MRAILVSVDYADLLAVTLPYNRHHYDKVYVVTTQRDEETIDVCYRNGAEPLVTDLFYRDGATFNKWLALEWGLDQIGRSGWLAIMDADVLLPVGAHLMNPASGLGSAVPGSEVQPGLLYGALRRMLVDPIKFAKGFEAIGDDYKLRELIPPHTLWQQLPIHRNVNEWAGYLQVFHASDPVLGPPPWHQVDWKHAGGADSFFQAKWPVGRKKRYPWEVLHLGAAGENWLGRASTRLDGTVPEGAEEKRRQIAAIWRNRHARRAARLDPFADEQLKR
jgi:hypothetical protein